MVVGCELLWFRAPAAHEHELSTDVEIRILNKNPPDGVSFAVAHPGSLLSQQQGPGIEYQRNSGVKESRKRR